MPVSPCRYLHFDVFTTRRFEGNQLAVFPDAGGIPPQTMQQIAREIGFSETTFVAGAESPGTDVRMRIFTPGKELPMAGHPVVGSAFALARTGRIARGARDWTFGLNIGPTPVALEWTADGLSFAWMTQRTPEFGEVVADVATIARGLAVRESDITETGLPVQTVSCGVPFLIVPLATRSAVDAAVPDGRVLTSEVYVFTTDRGDGRDRADTYSRMFAPAFGIPEDPATGGAGGPLGSYLVKHSALPAARERAILNLQGSKLGRPSWIHIAIDSSNGDISRVRVGGASVFVAEGVMDVEV